MEGDIELKPCPLCGSANVKMHTTSQVRSCWSRIGWDAIGYTVECMDCGCTIPSDIGKNYAAATWNRRDEKC